MISLETSRLIMRQFLPEDAENFFRLNSDPLVMQHTGDKAFANVAESLRLIENYDQYKKYGLGRLTILQKSDMAFVGWCGLKYLEDIEQIDLGYRLMRKFWGMGYATEAGLENIRFGFSKPDVTEIIGMARKANVASIHVLEKVGMNYIKDFVREGAPSVYYSISRKKRII